jgi:PAS domain-containing protein
LPLRVEPPQALPDPRDVAPHRLRVELVSHGTASLVVGDLSTEEMPRSGTRLRSTRRADKKLVMTSSLSGPVVGLVQRALLGEIADTMQLGLLAWDGDGTYLAANEAACRLTGYTRDELLALRVGALGGGLAAATPAQRHAGRATIVRADGGELEVEWVSVVARVATQPAMVRLFWPAGERG